MTIGSTIAIDFDNFFRHIDQLKQVFTETKECLDEVDYNEHFDPGKRKKEIIIFALF